MKILTRIAKLTSKGKSLSALRETAHRYLVSLSQKGSFREEIDLLKKGEKLPQSSQLYRLNPFLDNHGLLRTQSRLHTLRYISYDQANPVILRAKCPIARSIIENAHVKYQHTVSLNSMLATLFKKYHFLSLTKVVKDIMKRCIICRKRAAKKSPTLMSPLKKSIVEQRPFAETGIDFAGPFSVKVGRGKVRKQMYVLVLTCMNTRCVHFEVCEDQKTSSVLSAISRFANLRGLPSVIKSDNQTSFVSANKELSDFINTLEHEKIQEGLQNDFDQPIEWIFIPPRAPHFGGSWEIMVKAMKRAVETLTEAQDVSEDQFRTVISKAAALLNSRPLTKTFLEEKEVIVTPSSFLIGNHKTDFVTPDQELRYTKLGAKFREVVKIEKEIWRHFIREILPEISPRTKWYKTFPPLKIGDLVLVIEEGTPRGHWKMALVEEVKTSTDGIVRSAKVRMNDRTFDRPIINLFPLFDTNL
mgnify:FL=1